MSFLKALIIICGVGLLLGLGIHVGTFVGYQMPNEFSFITGVLHVGAIFAVGGFVVFVNQGKNHEIMKKLTGQGFASTFVFKLLMMLFMLYAAANFMMNVRGGTFELRNGKYVESSRGKVLRTYPNKAAFMQAKQLTRIHQTRGFSGHWLAFYGGVLLMSLLFVRRREEIEAELAREAEKGAADKAEAISRLQNSGDIVLTSDEIPSMGARIWGYKPAKSLLVGMGAQIVVLGGLLVFIPQATALFVMGMVVCTLGLVSNLLIFRGRVKHLITSISFATECCQIEYLQGNTTKHLELSYEESEMVIDVENLRGHKLVFLLIKCKGKTTIKQLCDGPGPWTTPRCEALVQAWQDKRTS